MPIPPSGRPPPSARPPHLPPPPPPQGSAIAVWSSFEGSWSSGFEIAEVLQTSEGPRVRVRRVSDGAVLPALFAADQVTAGGA
jgi:hypothetical protein